MLRKEVRLRKEYLYRKAQEEQTRKLHDRKAQLKAALADNRLLPAELARDAATLAKQLAYDEPLTAAASAEQVAAAAMDDEYAQAGRQDPKVLITTSRDPSARLAQFAKELRLVFPNAQRINRGNHVMADIVKACRTNAVTDLVIVHEHRGTPDGLIVCHFPYGPTAFFSLHNVTMRHDLRDALPPETAKVSEAYPHLVFSNFGGRLGSRVQTILKHLFPVPKPDSHRVITFANRDDYVSFRHHIYKKTTTDTGKRGIELFEVGPRFELKPYEIKLGTVELTDADSEWKLRPYMNTAKKRQFLS